MRIGQDRTYQLTYCTNIHPANGWEEVFATLQRYAPELKSRFSPDQPFAIGLRLSGQESRELLEGDRLQQFRTFLDEQGLYIFTLNGFPYGPFHKQPVKAEVHAPDWREEERVEYTLRLIRILAVLLPDGIEGSISTSPLSYKAWVDAGDEATWERLTRNIVRVAEELVRVRQKDGQRISLAIEPEPDGLIENSRELVRFYEDWLLTRGADQLAEALGIGRAEACGCLQEHVGVCFDTCHVAVAYEEPVEVLQRFSEAGIRVGKVQISSALKIPLPDDAVARGRIGQALGQFVESTYLHQVVQRNRDGSFRQYPDLADALPAIGDPGAVEWRVHFHVPIFLERYGLSASTQDVICQTFDLLREQRFSQQLEIETYTWGVLPPDLKTDLLSSIGREYEWVLDVFA